MRPALTFATCAGVTLASLGVAAGLVTSPNAAPATGADARVAPAALSEHTERLLLTRFVLHGLLLPLIDDSARPPTWNDPATHLSCADPSSVTADGAAVSAGAPLPGRAFTLRWHLEGCLPFGSGGPQLDGTAGLDVFVDDEGVSAIVRYEDLEVREASGATQRLHRRFAVSL